ncbi:hypothetical protein SmJEL517_g00033 [Synchytrium microbalum]|uniref:CBS domain-containing protein n=1 Tax=Synchytrium microbalum TaxID=1806994 RepID=A0A507CJ22_9FUNG|nr:uncharacterized protein SmJEL517_g00033 [Synchytrium microbalum]TPX38256.1 hypothetical protein SmJEL517_g00033 [Synchytrium microbalum]
MTKLLDLTIAELNLHHTKPAAISISPDTTIKDALVLLKEKNILAFPLQSRSNVDKITSLVNVFDILLYGSDQIEKKGKLDLTRPVDEVLSLDDDRESYLMQVFDYRDTLREVMNVFKTGHHHRAWISDAMNVLPSCIMTQSDIIRYTYAHPDFQVGCDKQADLITLGLVPDARPIHSITINATAVQGFQTMRQQNVLALPILGKHNEIISTLSASDLRGLTEEKFGSFNQPVMDFLGSTAKVPVTCTGADSLQSVIDKIIAKHVHRVWVVDGDNKVIGVVSLSDVISALAGK